MKSTPQSFLPSLPREIIFLILERLERKYLRALFEVPRVGDDAFALFYSKIKITSVDFFHDPSLDTLEHRLDDPTYIRFEGNYETTFCSDPIEFPCVEAFLAFAERNLHRYRPELIEFNVLNDLYYTQTRSPWILKKASKIQVHTFAIENLNELPYKILSISFDEDFTPGNSMPDTLPDWVEIKLPKYLKRLSLIQFPSNFNEKADDTTQINILNGLEYLYLRGVSIDLESSRLLPSTLTCLKLVDTFEDMVDILDLTYLTRLKSLNVRKDSKLEFLLPSSITLLEFRDAFDFHELLNLSSLCDLRFMDLDECPYLALSSLTALYDTFPDKLEKLVIRLEYISVEVATILAEASEVAFDKDTNTCIMEVLNFPKSLRHLEFLGRVTLRDVNLPPNLQVLHSRYANYNDFSKLPLPQTLRELHVKNLRMAVTSGIRWPPCLKTLSIQFNDIYEIDDLNFESLVETEKLELYFISMSSTFFSLRLPPKLQHFLFREHARYKEVRNLHRTLQHYDLPDSLLTIQVDESLISDFKCFDKLENLVSLKIFGHQICESRRDILNLPKSLLSLELPRFVLEDLVIAPVLPALIELKLTDNPGNAPRQLVLSLKQCTNLKVLKVRGESWKLIDLPLSIEVVEFMYTPQMDLTKLSNLQKAQIYNPAEKSETFNVDALPSAVQEINSCGYYDFSGDLERLQHLRVINFCSYAGKTKLKFPDSLVYLLVTSNKRLHLENLTFGKNIRYIDFVECSVSAKKLVTLIERLSKQEQFKTVYVTRYGSPAAGFLRLFESGYLTEGMY